MTSGYLTKSYGNTDADSIRAHYDAWAANYDAEIQKNGYATPGRCAAALAQFAAEKHEPVLDFGCGTGLSGMALRLAGFDVIDGVDISADMLNHAQTTNAYRHLHTIKADAGLPMPQGTYPNIAAIGAIGAGAAPISVFHMLMKSLPRHGKMVFSLNDHSLEDPENNGAISEWTDCGAAHLLFKEYGDHLPGIGLKCNVYVIEKT